MGLGGFILGGALSGLGAGMQAQVEQTALERREARLTAARQAERTEDRSNQIDDRQYAKDALFEGKEMDFNNNVSLKGIDHENAVGLAGMAETAGIAADERKNTYQTERDERQNAHEIERIKKEYGFQMTAEERRRTLDREDELGKPLDISTDYDTGYRVITYKDEAQPNGHRIVKIPINANKPTKKGEGSNLTEDHRKPAKGNAQAAAKQLRAAPPPKAKVQTMTRNQLIEAAKVSGRTESEMMADAKRLGITVN